MKHSFIDKYSDLNSPVHRIDPRAKLIATFSAIVIIVSEPHGNFLPFAFYGIIIFWVISISKVPTGYILKRCLVVSPFIIIAAVSYPLSLTETDADKAGQLLTEGINTGLTIFLKAFFALLLLILLTSASRFHHLLAGLRMLGMPRLFGVISALMYRYVFILHDELLKTNRARDSRTPGKIRINRFRVYGNQAALIFIRSLDRSQIVYNSMLSRGFSGRFPDMNHSKLRIRDVLMTGFFVLLLFVFRMINQLMIDQLLN